MIFQILDIFWRLWFFHKRPTLKEKTKSSLAPATPSKMLKIMHLAIKNQNVSIDYSANSDKYKYRKNYIESRTIMRVDP